MRYSITRAACPKCASAQEVAIAKFCVKCGAEIQPADTLDSAFKTALFVHATVLVLSACILDGGRSHQLCLITMVGYWIGVVLLMSRRRKAPTIADFWFIRYSVIPLWIAAPYVAEAVYRYIGESSQSGIERFF